MEIRRLSLCLAFLLVAVISHSSEARHSMTRREASNDFYQDDAASDNENELNDEAGEEDGDILENITIVTKPESYNVPAGIAVRLECRLDTKSPDASQMLQWRKGDITLTMLGSSTLDKNKYTLDYTDLVIKNLSVADSGIYQCLVVGQTPPTMIEHRVTVHPLDVSQQFKPKIMSVTASDDGKPSYGSDLILTCNATGKPTPEIHWSKGNGSMNERVGEGSPITIKNVREKDSGRYLCYAISNKTTDVKAIDVFVQKVPRFHPHKTIINSAIGVEALMECSVHEDGPVTISWYKGEQRIDPARYTTRGTHSNLTVVPQTDDDFGTYTCQAESDFGTHKRSTVLVERPVVEGLESDGQKLAWTVHSHQPLTSIEIQLIETATGNLTILPVSIPDYKTHEYDLSYLVDSTAVKQGNYEVVIKVENTKGVAENINPIYFEQVAPSDLSSEIVQASFGNAPGAAPGHHPTAALISTVLMYLLVRTI